MKRPIDFDLLKERLNLLDLIEADLGPGKRSSRWYMFSCPFPGHKHGDENPSLAVTEDNGRYHCFTCGQSGDSVTWLVEYRQMSWKQIAELAGSDDLPEPKPRPAAQPLPAQPAQAPGDLWQAQALGFVGACESALWSPTGARALAWLHDVRGLTDDTIKRYRLGYNQADKYEPRPSWGLPDDSDSKSVWLPRGIVIPWLIDGVLWAANIRRPTGEPKYHKLTGSKAALFGADNLLGAETVLLTEGEFDCILADQVLGDVAGVATLGSASKGLDLTTWGRYLLPARAVLLAYDLDPAGKSGLAKLLDKSARFHPARVPALRPGDKDLTDYHQAGGDLWEWLKYNLDRLGLLKAWGVPFDANPCDPDPVPDPADIDRLQALALQSARAAILADWMAAQPAGDLAPELAPDLAQPMPALAGM